MWNEKESKTSRVERVERRNVVFTVRFERRGTPPGVRNEGTSMICVNMNLIHTHVCTTQDFNDIEHAKSMLRPIMKLVKKRARRKTSQEDDALPTISTDIGSKHVGRMIVDDDEDDTLEIVQFDNFVDVEEDEDEKKNDSVRVEPVSSFSSEQQS